MHDDPDKAASDQLAIRVREALARRRISRQRLADEARISLSTLEKALAGRRPFTLATVIRIEEVLGINLREEAVSRQIQPPGGLASAELGAYARPAVAWLEGNYLTLRPSFKEPGCIYAYCTRIRWDDARSHLVFSEEERLDSAFAQAGIVSLPHQSGHIYLVTNQAGQYRVATLGRPTIQGEIYGVLATLLVGQGSQLVPAAAPLALLPLPADPVFGGISPDNARHADYRRHIDRIINQDFARFVT